MKINLTNFEELLRKATINFSIETLQLRFGEKIETNMLSADGNCISILKIPNNVLDTNDELTFNFSDPSNNVMPYIGLFDNEDIDISITDSFMKLADGSQISKISFCSDTVVKLMGTNSVKEDVEWFFETGINEDFMAKFSKIQQIGARFSKVYLDVNDGRVFLETADKTNPYSNGLKFQLADTEDANLTLCFTFKDMVNLMKIIDLDKEFIAKFTYDKDQELGMIYVFSNDETEKYCLLSREL